MPVHVRDPVLWLRHLNNHLHPIILYLYLQTHLSDYNRALHLISDQGVSIPAKSHGHRTLI